MVDMFGLMGKMVVFVAGAVGLGVFIYFFRKQDASDAKKYYANLIKSILLGSIAFLISIPVIVYFGWKSV